MIGVLVLGLKFLAAQLTGSVALWSDALESIVNVAAAVGALVAVRVAARPPDADHLFGHGKAEYLSAVAEGVLIVVAAVAILHEAWNGLQAGTTPDFSPAGLAVSLVASAINGGWAMVLIRYGRRLRSSALSADGHHLMTDVVTSVGVLIGVGLAKVTGLPWLDPALAAVVGCVVIYTGWQLVTSSVAGLMDAAPDPELVSAVRGAIAQTLPADTAYHALRFREAGHQHFVEFHLTVDGATTVADSHALCDRLEAAIKPVLPGGRILIHVEPASPERPTVSGIPGLAGGPGGPRD